MSSSSASSSATRIFTGYSSNEPIGLASSGLVLRGGLAKQASPRHADPGGRDGRSPRLELRDARQRDREGGAAARRLLERYVAAVQGHERTHDAQPQAHADTARLRAPDVALED